jgi:hypothetical protein
MCFAERASSFSPLLSTSALAHTDTDRRFNPTTRQLSTSERHLHYTYVSYQLSPLQMMRSAICGMTAATSIYLLLCSERMLDTVERPPMVRPHATLVYGLDDGCGLADSLWCDARTNAVCNLAVTSIGPEWARNTATKTLRAAGSLCKRPSR